MSVEGSLVVILTSGCFDGFHAGHLHYLEGAAALRQSIRERLMVAVAPDEYLQQVKGRCRWPVADRAQVICGLRVVDPEHVLIHDPVSVASVIRELRPRLFVKGGDWRWWQAEDVIEACEAVGTAIELIREIRVAHNTEVYVH